MKHLDHLLQIGFTPAAALAITALIIVAPLLWLRIRAGEKKNEVIREAWHAATRSEMDGVKTQAEQCVKDREELRKETTECKVEIAKMKEKIRLFANCPNTSCPISIKGKWHN